MDQQDGLSDVIAALSPHLSRAAESGGRLPPERRLAEMLNIPRRRLRLALDELQRRGAVFRRHGQGTFISPPPRPDTGRHRFLAGRLTLDQLMDVRCQIEPRLAELAATRVTLADIRQLDNLLRNSRGAATPREYDLADEVFHYRIAELAGNALFLEIYDLIRQLRREAGWRERREETNVPGMIRVLGEQHQQIFDAIAAGNPTAAGEAVHAHLAFVASAIDGASGRAGRPESEAE